MAIMFHLNNWGIFDAISEFGQFQNNHYACYRMVLCIFTFLMDELT